MGQDCGPPASGRAWHGSQTPVKPVVTRQGLGLTPVPSTGLILIPPMGQHPVPSPKRCPMPMAGAVPYCLLAALLLAGVVGWALDARP